MIRFFLLRIVLPLVAFLILRSVVISIWRALSNSGSTASPKQAGSTQAAGELKKDPVCGTFVSTVASITKTVDGKVIHFCSKDCRDKFGVA